MVQRSTSARHSNNGDRPAPKRAAILAAATRLFLEHGYGAVSMDAIAQEAGVSKQTIYSHFGAKDTLFGAIIHEKCGQLLGPLQAPDARNDDPAAALNGIAQQFLELVLDAQNMAHFRTIIAESSRFPELAKAFYDAGPRRAADSLADYLAAMDRGGTLRVDDPAAAARQFFAMMRGDLYMRRLLGLGGDPDPAEVRRVASRAVSAFLAVFATH